MAISRTGDLVNPAERLALEELERAEKRRQELAEQRSELNPPHGQFDLDGAVRAALADPTHRAEGVLECHGSRGQDPASRRACLLQLTYKVTATYQQPG